MKPRLIDDLAGAVQGFRDGMRDAPARPKEELQPWAKFILWAMFGFILLVGLLMLLLQLGILK